MNPKDHPIAIIGGGIQGVAIAREAAARGISCILFEQNDFAQNGMPGLIATSSDNLRKLEHLALYDIFHILREQQRLHQRAEPFTQELDYFVIPNPTVRSATKIRIGVGFLSRIMGCSGKTDLHLAQLALKTALPDKHQFREITANETRIVIATAQQAVEYGAELHNYCDIVAASRSPDYWQLRVEGKQSLEVRCRALINCTGSAATQVIEEVLGCRSRCRVNSVYHGYIVINKTYLGRQGYVAQLPDGQLLYITPLGDRTLQIGPIISQQKPSLQDLIRQLTTTYNQVFSQAVSHDDIIRTHVAERAAYEDPCEHDHTRLLDSLVDLNIGHRRGQAPLLTVFGSQFSLHKHLAERALEIIQPHIGKHRAEAPRNALLPGCDRESYDALLAELRFSYPALEGVLLSRLARCYGSRAYDLLQNTSSVEELGEYFGAGVYAAELDYVQEREWVSKSEDFVVRRAQFIRPLDVATRQNIERYLAQREPLPGD